MGPRLGTDARPDDRGGGPHRFDGGVDVGVGHGVAAHRRINIFALRRRAVACGDDAVAGHVRDATAKRAIRLNVSAPFHCALMEPAAEAMAEALESTPPRAPIVPLIANVSALKATDPAEITAQTWKSWP